MSRPSQTEVAYVQTFVRSPDFRAFMSRLLCVHQTFVRSCPDFRAFTRLSCAQPIFVRSCPDFCAFYRLLWVHVQTYVPEKLLPWKCIPLFQVYLAKDEVLDTTSVMFAPGNERILAFVTSRCLSCKLLILIVLQSDYRGMWDLNSYNTCL